MNKKYIAVAVVCTSLLVGGCASQIVDTTGTVIDSVGNVTSSVWHLATDWITGADEVVVPEVVVPEVVVPEVVAPAE